MLEAAQSGGSSLAPKLWALLLALSGYHAPVNGGKSALDKNAMPSAQALFQGQPTLALDEIRGSLLTELLSTVFKDVVTQPTIAHSVPRRSF